MRFIQLHKQLVSASKVIYIVSGWALNFTHSLTHSLDN